MEQGQPHRTGQVLKWAIPRPPATTSVSPPRPTLVKVPAPASAATVTTIHSANRRPSAANSWVDGDGYLKPTIGAAMKKAIVDRRVKPGAVMREMGLKALDARLSLAIRRRWRPTTEFLDLLPGWLKVTAR